MIIMRDEFKTSLERLGTQDRGRVQDAVFKMMSQPADAAGLRRKKMKRADYLEFRASDNLRIIGRQEGADLILFTVDRHDEALRAAERGRFEMGLADIERFRTLESPLVSLAPTAEIHRTGPLAAFRDEDLAARFGISTEWIPCLRAIRTEEQFAAQPFEEILSQDAYWELAALFPAEQIVSTAAAPTYRALDRELLRKHFNGDIEELEYNLPAESWAVIERTRSGATLVRGGPGSGKSLVLIYRGLNVLERPALGAEPRVLYATYTKQLTRDARAKLQRLRGSVPENFTVKNIDKLAFDLARGSRIVYDDSALKSLLSEISNANAEVAAWLDLDFVFDEITTVIEWRGVATLEAYAALARVGRGKALRAEARKAIWSIYETYRAELARREEQTRAMLFERAMQAAAALPESDRYDTVLIDEVQDLPTPAIALLLALAKGTGRAKDVLIAGDSGQSIYSRGFSWRDVGMRFGGANVFTLKSCERSTSEIVAFTSGLLEGIAEFGEADVAAPTSLHGELPIIIEGLEDRDDQRDCLIDEVQALIATGVRPSVIAVLARSQKEVSRVVAALQIARIPVVEQGDPSFFTRNAVRALTCHSAKGLEFPHVFLLGADEGTFPLRHAADLPADELDALTAQDLRLLYVGASRARRGLTLICGRSPSRFLEQVKIRTLCRVRSIESASK